MDKYISCSTKQNSLHRVQIGATLKPVILAFWSPQASHQQEEHVSSQQLASGHSHLAKVRTGGEALEHKVISARKIKSNAISYIIWDIFES